ncbi:sugar ABC transporter permease [Cohnella endophytica]|uniref:Sugar ABC transporter permease n=1 Tax=Cohnella endophytica TaxID=2419778 RepID=A0A494XJK9_9BACL|nr:sugar ABC transporter permease [Cohnella endophytica]RKP49901.1 sugar ABC transporter permease [Cohnella endophytica]
MTQKVLKRITNAMDSDKKLGYLLIFPSLLVILGVMLYPFLYSLNMSFSKMDFANRTMNYIGLDNYIRMFKDSYFINSLRLTGYFTIVTVIAEISLGIAIALVLNQKFKFRGFVRGIMILPWALPSVVNAIMWKWIYNPNYGALNALLTQMHIIGEYRDWLGEPSSALHAMIFANVWKETPYVVLLVLAALSNISGDLYESAKIDGANAWQAFWKVTLPIVKPVIVVLAIMKSIWAIQTFELPYILTGGGPGGGTELLSFYIYKATFKFLDFGMGASMAYMITLVTFVLSLLYIKFLSKDGEIV